jgi:nucleoside-diphosphate-sugar epimerase
VQLFSKHGLESRRKVVAISGDVSKSGLALSEEDKSVLIDTVSVVFHAAATINFNATLQSAINTNLIGTQRVLQLCHHMPNITVRNTTMNIEYFTLLPCPSVDVLINVCKVFLSSLYY